MAPLAAAAVLLLAIFPTLQARRDAASFRAPAAQIASSLAQPGAGLDERNWSVTRGGSSRLVDTTIAFRLGVRTVDLHVALAAGDTARAGRLIGEMVGLLEPVELSDAVEADYAVLRQQLASGAARDSLLAGASRAEGAAEEFLGSRWFGFGKWFAAGELAARTRSASFFASPGTARFLDAAIEHGHLAPDDVELLRQVALLGGQSVSGENFEAIQRNFLELIRRHGG